MPFPEITNDNSYLLLGNLNYMPIHIPSLVGCILWLQKKVGFKLAH